MLQRVLGALAALAFFSQAPALLGQATPARPEFEVASIKPSVPDEFERGGAGGHIDGSQISLKFLSLSSYIAYAYRVKNYAISGPDWLASERFDIVAKLPAGAAAKQIPEMLQALLEDRFQMKMHRESRELTVYAMVIGKDGLKVQESPTDSPAATLTTADRASTPALCHFPGALWSTWATAPFTRLRTTNSRAEK